MRTSAVLLTAGLLVAASLPALAQQGARGAPPAGSLPLSQIVSQIEARPDFAFVTEAEWDDDGYYEVEYRTRDGQERVLKIDPRSGNPITRN